MSEPGGYRIRLNGFWTASALPDGRTRHARRFGRPRTLDADESVWVSALNVTAPASVSINAQLIGETRKPRAFAFEIPFSLEPRNDLAIDVSADATLGDVALEIRRLSFEPARPTDYDFAHDLARANMAAFVARHWGGWDADTFRRNFDRTENYLIDLSGNPVGFVRLAVEGDRLLLDDLQVAPELQNAGLGTWSLKQVEAIAARRNLVAVRLRCFRENPAYNLYRRFGFQVMQTDGGADGLEKTVAKEQPCAPAI